MLPNEHQGFTTKTYFFGAVSFDFRSVPWYYSDNFVKPWPIARKMETYPGLVLAHCKSGNWFSVQVCLEKDALSQNKFFLGVLLLYIMISWTHDTINLTNSSLERKIMLDIVAIDWDTRVSNGYGWKQEETGRRFPRSPSSNTMAKVN